jgi:Flp pilus assembly protein TadD
VKGRGRAHGAGMNARFLSATGSEDFELLSSIDAMYGRLGGTYFEILGVSRGCDAASLRRGYRQVCERFHPDLYADIDLGARRPQLEVIFREATNAFMVLCRPDLRAEYERELAPSAEPYGVATPPTPATVVAPVAQSVIAFGDRPAENIATPIPAAAASATSSPSSLRAPTPVLGVGSSEPLAAVEPPSASARAASKLKRTPMAAMHAPLAPSAQRPEAPPPPVSATRAEAARPEGSEARPAHLDRPTSRPGVNPASERPSSRPGLDPGGERASSRPSESAAAERSPSREVDSTTATSLQRGRAEMLLRQRRKMREELDAQVSAAIARGDIERAMQTLRHALTLSPDDEALTRRLQQLEAASKTDDVDRIAQAAKGHERAGRLELAAQTWSRAAAQHPQEYSFHLYAAQAYCESGNELPKAVDLARRAARLRPDAVEPHVCLARAFFRAGSVASAKAALEQATKLAPQNPAVLELARQLRI